MESEDTGRHQLQLFLDIRHGKFLRTRELELTFGANDWSSLVKDLVSRNSVQLIPVKREDGRKPDLFFVMANTNHAVSAASNNGRTTVLDRGAYCKMCGRQDGDDDPTTPMRTLRLHSLRSTSGPAKTRSNSEQFCTACFEGMLSWKLIRATTRSLIERLKNATTIDQIDVLRWLITEHPDHASRIIQTE